MLMNRQQRRRADREPYNEMWHSDDLEVPLGDFMSMFDLTPEEARLEALSGRITFIGSRLAGCGWGDLAAHEKEIQRWILRRDLPPEIAAKADGGLERLRAWHVDYWAKIKIDWEGSAFILPSGERIGVMVDADEFEKVLSGRDKH
jgi:hypothetical protein